MYKLQRLKHTMYDSPMRKRLVRSGLHLYLALGPTMLLISIGAIFAKTQVLAITRKSGLLWAILSSMYTRLILATRSLDQDREDQNDVSIDLHTISSTIWDHPNTSARRCTRDIETSENI
ncbi:hypothetical protein FRC12_014637 [Ceratobasidium sp. 428]|nr:hypothetical protein FRC12_014637 [Ceratobasidium sp. 428]